MSIERIAGRNHLRCDHSGCTAQPAPVGYRPEEFFKMLADAKSIGWSVKKRGGSYIHRCPDHSNGTPSLF